jgi:DNA-binding NarL/FixJ family response regulator
MKKSDFHAMILRLVDGSLPAEFPPACSDVVVLDSIPFFATHKSSICRLRSDGTPVRGLLVAMEDDKDQFLAAVRHGASGYILQDASAMEVVTGIRAVAQGEAVCPLKMAKFLFDYVASHSAAARNSKTCIESKLTRREQELVPLIGQGLTNKEIAVHLNLSEETVKSHMHRILRKVGVENRRSAFEACQANNPDL